MLVIEYKVHYVDGTAITFCGKFSTIEAFENYFKQKNSLFIGYKSHSIISVKVLP